MQRSDRRDSALMLSLEAWLLVPLFAVALRVWPGLVMRRGTRLRRRDLNPVRCADLADRVALAVERAAARLPARVATCLPRAFTVHLMLTRRGAESHLRIGVLKPSKGAMRAHAWVDAGSREIGVDGTGPVFTTLPVA